MNLRPVFGASAPLLLVLACSSGSSSGNAATSDSFVSQFCGIYAPCCTKAGLSGGDGAPCRAVYGALTGSMAYNAAAGDACLADARAASSNADFCENGPPSGSCKSVYKSASTGKKAPGDACTDDGECASSTEGEVVCASSFASGGTETRVCQLQVKGKDGDSPCVGTVDGSNTSFSFSSDQGPPPSKGYLCNVADGLHCDFTTKKCVRLQDVGGACTTSDDCMKTAWCDSTAKKCAARRPAGADCDTFATRQCDEKLTCDKTSKKCTAGLADGAACTSGDQCASRSCVNSKCGGSSGNLTTAFLCGK